MIACLNVAGRYVVEHLHEDNSPRLEHDTSVDYYAVRNEKDPFPDRDNLELLNRSQEVAVTTGIKNKLQDAKNGLPLSELKKLCVPIAYHKNVWKLTLPEGLHARMKQLRTDLLPKARSERERLQNYFQDPWPFLEKFVTQLLQSQMPNPSPPRLGLVHLYSFRKSMHKAPASQQICLLLPCLPLNIIFCCPTWNWISQKGRVQYFTPFSIFHMDIGSFLWNKSLRNVYISLPWTENSHHLRFPRYQ